MYYIDITRPARLIFEELAPRHAYHAAAVRLRGAGFEPHYHDYHEVMLVLDGQAGHVVNGQTTTIAAHDLLLVRPNDTHHLRLRGQGIEFLNIAFPSSFWEHYCDLLGLDSERLDWERAEGPPRRRLGVASCELLSQAAQRLILLQSMAAAYPAPTGAPPGAPHGPSGSLHGAAHRLQLCTFFNLLLPLLQAPSTMPVPALPHSRPAWLAPGIEAMEEIDNLRAGLPRLVQLCGVTPPHLARTLRSHYGETPTELINRLRLGYCCLQLLTTSRDILAIALDAGFGNLSYFYRIFKERYGVAPRAYRQNSQRFLTPAERRPGGHAPPV